MVPDDVVVALGTRASVGKGGEKGGSRYQESVAESEWDFFGGGGEWGRCDVGMWELRSHRPAAVKQTSFCMLILVPLPSALPGTKELTLPPPPPSHYFLLFLFLWL